MLLERHRVGLADVVVRATLSAGGDVENLCAIDDFPRDARWFGDIDGDGIVDAAGVKSGAYTTSSYLSWYGAK